MTPNQIELVQKTWTRVAPIGDTAATLFYGKLFELDPALRKLFNGSMEVQGRKLMTMIGTAVNGLGHVDEILPAVRELGQRHVRYGVKDAHYDTVGAALLWTLERGLGEAFTPPVKQAWSTAYLTLADVMKDAAAQVAA
jgi:hemoglobin-like flavoprotein